MGNFVIASSFYRKAQILKYNVYQESVDAQSSTEKREDYRVYYNTSPTIESSFWLAIKNWQKHNKQTNRITTTRYNILTFLPKNLLEQFHRVANIYFALLIVLNSIPVLNAINRTVKYILSYRYIS